MDETIDGIYYVDTRNADSRDHRTGSSGSSGWRPSAPPPSRTVYLPPGAGRVLAPVTAPVIYAQPPQSAVASLFGKLTTGQVIEMVAQLFASLQPLPAAPIGTKDAATDIQNMMLFQGALAQHAKRDEQVRTLGGLVSKLVG